MEIKRSFRSVGEARDAVKEDELTQEEPVGLRVYDFERFYFYRNYMERQKLEKKPFSPLCTLQFAHFKTCTSFPVNLHSKN